VPIEYKDLTSTRETDCGINPGGGTPCIQNGVICPSGLNDAPYYAGGLGFCWTYRNHPDWFYRNNGQMVTEIGYPTQYVMDWANPAYQRAWADAVAANVQSSNWGWVWMDNALTNPYSYTSFQLYGGAQATQDATLAMLEVVSNTLHPLGVRFIVNLGWTDRYPTLWDAWLPLVDGFTNEHNVGDVVNEQLSCRIQGKVCLFNMANTFTVVASATTSPPLTSTSPPPSPCAKKHGHCPSSHQ
jgi:Hypothetical glycosyl hydrolase family 15